MNTVTKSYQLPLVLEFLATLNSKHTMIAYHGDLKAFETFVTENAFTVEGLMPEHLGLYREGLRQHRSLASVNRALACLKGYFKFLIVHNVLTRNPTELIRGFPSPEYVETPGISNEETVKLLASVDGEAPHGPLHHAVLSILFYMGLRRGELIGLNVESLDAEKGIPILRILGKGNRPRILPIPEPAFRSLTKYLNTRVYTRAEGLPLFVSTQGNEEKRLAPETVRYIVKKYAKLAGLPENISPHSARVTAVSNALENGASVIEVQTMGGWKSIDMVKRYDRSSKQIKNSAIWKINYGGAK